MGVFSYGPNHLLTLQMSCVCKCLCNINKYFFPGRSPEEKTIKACNPFPSVIPLDIFSLSPAERDPFQQNQNTFCHYQNILFLKKKKRNFAWGKRENSCCKDSWHFITLWFIHNIPCNLLIHCFWKAVVLRVVQGPTRGLLQFIFTGISLIQFYISTLVTWRLSIIIQANNSFFCFAHKSTEEVWISCSLIKSLLFFEKQTIIIYLYLYFWLISKLHVLSDLGFALVLR